MDSKEKILYFLAVLITGGFGGVQSAEIYHPGNESPCVLPDLPAYDHRYHHTQDGSLLCGGEWTLKSCRIWNPDTGAWGDLVTESLTKYRRGHISWTPVDGFVTYLMGGGGSPKTSEAIDKDNGVTSSFPLKHWTE